MRIQIDYDEDTEDIYFKVSRYEDSTGYRSKPINLYRSSRDIRKKVRQILIEAAVDLNH